MNLIILVSLFSRQFAEADGGTTWWMVVAFTVRHAKGRALAAVAVSRWCSRLRWQRIMPCGLRPCRRK
ncbi:hypothetical protein ABZ471_46800 [Streptomyces sp. NPDC005728]|uniref:hypothetical protein n=1 Tax=Streptomyces sp. NPDC005728 TaxID=3157054 RepID=UPI0034045544